MKTVPSEDIRWTHVPEYPSCRTLDIASYFDFSTSTPKQIYFAFNRVKNLHLGLHVVEKNRALRRPLKVFKCLFFYSTY